MNRRPQFGLRFLILLTAAIAFASAIIANRGHAQREALKTVERLGGTCVFDYQQLDDNYHGSEVRVLERNDGWLARWLRRYIGPEYFSDVVIVSLHDTAATDADMASLRPLTRLQVLDIENTGVTEHGLTDFRQRTPPVQILK